MWALANTARSGTFLLEKTRPASAESPHYSPNLRVRDSPAAPGALKSVQFCYLSGSVPAYTPISSATKMPPTKSGTTRNAGAHRLRGGGAIPADT